MRKKKLFILLTLLLGAGMSIHAQEPEWTDLAGEYDADLAAETEDGLLFFPEDEDVNPVRVQTEEMEASGNEDLLSDAGGNLLLPEEWELPPDTAEEAEQEHSPEPLLLPDPEDDLLAEEEESADEELLASVTPVRLFTEDINTYFAWPVPSSKYVTSLDHHPNDEGGPGKVHGGMDISAEEGSDVLAAAAGTVVRVGNACPHVNMGKDEHNEQNCTGGEDSWQDFGNYVALEHNINGLTYITVYAHMVLDSISVQVGDAVGAGEKIGLVGSSGGSSSFHLHFEAYQHAYESNIGTDEMRALRSQTFQYYQNNEEILGEMFFPVRCRTATVYFNEWFENCCVLEEGGYRFSPGAESYVISFDPNGGAFREGEASEKTVRVSSVYGAMPSPVQTDCDLAGWFTQKEGGKQVLETDIVQAEGPRMLYAHWKEHEGWRVKGDYTYYYDEYGKMVTGLYEIRGDYYFFSDKGILRTECKIEIDGESYYFGADGKMQYSLFVTRENAETHEEYVYYFGPDGKMVRGLLKIGDNLYCFNENGTMKTDRLFILDDRRYFAGTDGKLLRNQFKDYNGYRYYFGEDGMAVTGVRKIGSYSYLFSEKGILCYDRIWRTGKDDYYFNTKGKMVINGWVDRNGYRYYAGDTGALVKEKKKKIGGIYYYFDAYGRMVKNKFVTISQYTYYFTGDGSMAKKWQTIGDYRYRFNNAGKMQTGLKTIGSYQYYFNEKGRMQVNKLVKIGNDRYFFNKKGRMIKKAWKSVLGDRYYFGKTGKAYTGTHKIGGKKYKFSASGKLIG